MKDKTESLITKLIDIENKIIEWNRKKSINRINFSLVILISFIAIFLLNLGQPIFGDDWGYSLLDTSNQRITNFPEIIEAQYHHYFNWGGRTVVHIIAQFLLMLDETLADLLNSLAYVALTLVIYRIATPSKRLYPSILIIINLLICIFQVSFGSTLLWITGSANYLWGTLIILLFLLPYVSEYRREEMRGKKTNYLKTGLIFLFGIIAGWTNENMGVALIFMLVFFCFVYKQQGKKIPKWAIFGLIGACIGCTMMLAAPGNYIRFDTSLDLTGQHSPLVLLFFNRAVASILGFYSYSLGLLFILAVVSILSMTLKNENKINKGRILSLIFFIGGIIATLAMSASPIFPGRASFGINALLVVAIALILSSFNFKLKVVSRLLSSLVIFGLAFYAVDYHKGYKDVTTAKTILDDRLKEIATEKEKGNLDITLHGVGIEAQTRYLHYYELRPNTDDWHNEMFSKYHQLDSIRFIRK